MLLSYAIITNPSSHLPATRPPGHRTTGPPGYSAMVHRQGYVPGGLEKHPLIALHRAGVPCALAADDPSFFGSRTSHGLLNEFIVARHLMHLRDYELAQVSEGGTNRHRGQPEHASYSTYITNQTPGQLARNSIVYSCAPAEVKAAMLTEVDEWLSRPPTEQR